MCRLEHDYNGIVAYFIQATGVDKRQHIYRTKKCKQASVKGNPVQMASVQILFPTSDLALNLPQQTQQRCLLLPQLPFCWSDYESRDPANPSCQDEDVQGVRFSP